ncbi:hypothetical protein ACJ3XI_00030 [Litorimonas sp. RW-G-Af-16]|uniref:hypothetical protein n=1 Tax=Litorimonas sp. RW-G-Af-16 TaxID=3241168 RepID=UPI00390CAE7F
MPRTAVMPAIPAALTIEPSSNPRCTWKEADLTVFNQPDQHLLFRYQQCPPFTVDGFSVIDGHIIVMEESIEGSHRTLEAEVMRLHKVAPFRPQEFVISQMSGNGQIDSDCHTIELAANIWIAQHRSNILDLEGTDPIEVEIDEALPCGRVTSFQDLTLTFFGIDQGIAFEIITADIGRTIDLSSIRYESRG